MVRDLGYNTKYLKTFFVTKRDGTFLLVSKRYILQNVIFYSVQ